MKKFKKILSAVSAAVLCSLPMMNIAAVDAAESFNTYRVYIDVKENSGISKCTIATCYADNMSFKEEQIGNLGGKVSSTKIGSGLGDGTMNQYVECDYETSGNLASSGTIFTMKYISNNTYEENEISFDFYPKNSNGEKLNENAVSRTAVLVGDVNNDGVVLLNDAICINQFVGNPEKYPLKNARAADVNNDGVITEEDATLIQKYCIHLIKYF